MEFIKNNYTWLFSGLGITIITIGILIVKKIWGAPDSKGDLIKNQIVNNNNIQLGSLPNFPTVPVLPPDDVVQDDQMHIAKQKIFILFVDDDLKFKVVTILRNAGWINTKTIKDVTSLDSKDVRDADILFVDIQGVGKILECKDEGLGLALNLKRKYPNKKVIIYSSETKGERFHEALKKADSFLAKNADPYEFQQLVEQYSTLILKDKL